MSRDTDAPPKRGIVHVRERAVHWVLGRCDAPRRELTHIAERWVEDMVTRELGLRWRGIDRGSGGEKPRLRGLDADFSVSHSGDVLLVAVGAGDGIGADVEAAPFTAFDSRALRRRMCSPAEAARSESLDSLARRRWLAPTWTAKEAAAKATGEGLGRDFRTLEVSATPAPDDAEAVCHIAVADASGIVAIPLILRSEGSVLTGSPLTVRTVTEPRLAS